MGDAVKRFLDVTLSIVALVVLSPLLAAVAIAVLITLGRPVLFTQMRPGLGGRLFRLYKFRTMRTGVAPTDAVTAVSSDADRLTRFGTWLRSTSIDELPSLLNIVRGDMSIVGPRPLLPEYLDLYTPEQAKRHDVKPGLTGWAQVNGRNAASWEDRLAMDAWYAQNRSLALDFRIVLMSVGAVLSKRGVSAPGEATVKPFSGTAEPDEENRCDS